jgi:signal transduction histidine kinase
VWIGTRNGRLVRWKDGEFKAWVRAMGIASSTIVSLLISSKSEVWMGQENPIGLQCLRDEKLVSYGLPPESRVIRALAEDAAGRIWMGTSKGLLLRVDNDRLVDETACTSLSQQAIRCLSATPDNSLWIGYAGAGLGRLKDGHFVRIGTTEGLFDNYISQIVSDGRGWLWFGSDRGIFKVRQRELDAVMDGKATRVQSIHYGREEGFPNLQAEFGFAPNAIRSRHGHLWMPMRSALAVINPENLRENLEPPPILLTRFKMDDRNIASYAGVVPLHDALDIQSKNKPVHLDPGHRRLEFDFTALTLSSPENVRFRYQLQGLDENWVEADSRRSVGYSRLPAGDYRFQVAACNSDGVWNETGAAFAFTVSPFVWKTWWFQLGIFACFTSCVATLTRYFGSRRLRWKLRLLEQQATLDRERTRIARDLHDDLGSRLTKIILLSEVTMQQIEEPEKVRSSSQEVISTARHVMKSLDETVWAVNPRNDTLAQLTDYIGQYAVDFLRSAGIRCRVDLLDCSQERPVPADVRHHLFLAVKEALTNVVRHASADEVWLRVNLNGEWLTVSVEDNGQGFDCAPADALADGLRNMRERMEEIRGRFQCETASGSGTRILLSVPYHDVMSNS